MSKRVFISFKAENKKMFDDITLLAKNPNYDLDLYAESARFPIDSRNAPYIKTVIEDKIQTSGVVLCIISTNTYKSDWVCWELETAIKLNKPIVAMAVKDLKRAKLPKPIRDKVEFFPWNAGSLGNYLQSAVTVK